MSNYKKILIVVISLLFGIVISLEWEILKNGIDYFISDFNISLLFVCKVLLFSVVFFLIIKLLSLVKLKVNKREIINDKKLRIITFMLVFISSSIFLLTYYPGSDMNDTIYILSDPIYNSCVYPYVYSICLSFIFKFLLRFFSDNLFIYLKKHL